MKSLVCICLFGMIAVALARPEEDKYPTKYDSVNTDEILTNERLFSSYFKCLTDDGKCSAEGKELKSHIKDALENKCAKCNEHQKEEVHKVIGYLINHKEEEWKVLVAKYDPENKFSKKYEEELRKIKA